MRPQHMPPFEDSLHHVERRTRALRLDGICDKARNACIAAAPGMDKSINHLAADCGPNVVTGQEVALCHLGRDV